MNSVKFKKEIKNLNLLIEYFNKYGFSLGFWSFADGFVRRCHLNTLYEHTHKKRHEVCKDYLKKNYSSLIEEYRDRTIQANMPIQEDSTIWNFWLQGKENAPYPVNLCLNSVEKHAGKHPVITLNQNNYAQYCDIPNFIIEKLAKGYISIAHFSDILRISLLKQKGGIWLDSTFYMTEELQSDIYNKTFFSVCHNGRRKWVVSKDLWSVGFLASEKNNFLIDFCYDMLMAYWEKENTPICYLILDCIIAIAYEEFPEVKKMIDQIPTNNLGIFDFLEANRNDPCQEDIYKMMMERAYIHQLTYKNTYKLEANGHKTYFARLLED